jgi:hypothetical protein
MPATLGALTAWLWLQRLRPPDPPPPPSGASVNPRLGLTRLPGTTVRRAPPPTLAHGAGHATALGRSSRFLEKTYHSDWVMFGQAPFCCSPLRRIARGHLRFNHNKTFHDTRIGCHGAVSSRHRPPRQQDGKQIHIDRLRLPQKIHQDFHPLRCRRDAHHHPAHARQRTAGHFHLVATLN